MAWSSRWRHTARPATASPPPGSRKRSWSPLMARASSPCSRPRSFSSPTPTEARHTHTAAGTSKGPTPVSEHTADLLKALVTDLYIGGAAVPAAGGRRFDVLDPATGPVITTVADASVEDGIAAIDAADKAAPAWAATAPRQRAEILRRGFELMMRRADDLAALITLENGKALRDARGEVAYAAEFFRWYSEEAVRGAGSVMTAPSGANKILVLQQPVGICVLVTPWNFPAAMATRKIAPALAAGCTVVLKPASDTPLTALAMASILADAGVPPGVVNVLPSRRSGEVVSAMLHDSRVRSEE